MAFPHPASARLPAGATTDAATATAAMVVVVAVKVLTASHGERADDFAWTVPGEVVMLGMVCARDEYGDEGCGCGRAFTGLSSRRGTTVAVVADLEVDCDDLTGLLAASLADAGWSQAREFARAAAEEIADEAAQWPVGTRLRRVQPDDELVPA
jgi:hypothetical protein